MELLNELEVLKKENTRMFQVLKAIMEYRVSGLTTSTSKTARTTREKIWTEAENIIKEYS
jgi:hypothetical protein